MWLCSRTRLVRGRNGKGVPTTDPSHSNGAWAPCRFVTDAGAIVARLVGGEVSPDEVQRALMQRAAE
jgi:hypothetical protein